MAEEKIERYDWVTSDMFNEVLETIMMENTETLLHVPGVFEALSEHFNNEVLQRCEEQRDDPPPHEKPEKPVPPNDPEGK